MANCVVLIAKPQSVRALVLARINIMHVLLCVFAHFGKTRLALESASAAEFAAPQWANLLRTNSGFFGARTRRVLCGAFFYIYILKSPLWSKSV